MCLLSWIPLIASSLHNTRFSYFPTLARRAGGGNADFLVPCSLSPSHSHRCSNASHFGGAQYLPFLRCHDPLLTLVYEYGHEWVAALVHSFVINMTVRTCEQRAQPNVNIPQLI